VGKGVLSKRTLITESRFADCLKRKYGYPTDFTEGGKKVVARKLGGFRERESSGMSPGSPFHRPYCGDGVGEISVKSYVCSEGR